MLNLSPPICKMNEEQLQQIINQTRTSIDRDEAIGKQSLACAAEKRTLLDALEALQAENKRLREEKKVVNHYQIEHDFVQSQTINTLGYERGNK